MLDHVSIGVRDLAVARRFYAAALEPLGYRAVHDSAESVGFGAGEAQFWLNPVARPVPADPESGLHFSFVAPTPKGVDAFHRAALAKGGKDNGKPGFRPDYGAGYYAAFVIDPDGYRLEAHCQVPE